VGVKPLLILLVAQFDTILASKLALVFIVSSIVTSTLSVAYYKTYMPIAIKYGASSVSKNILLHSHISIACISLFGVILNVENWITVSLILEFVLHQYARVNLYRKEFRIWAVISILIPFIFILSWWTFNSYKLEGFNAVVFVISVVGILVNSAYTGLLEFLTELKIGDSIFGISRKLYTQSDKLIVGFMYDPNVFWVVAILYQIMNSANIIFDTIVVMPNKKEIATNRYGFDFYKIYKSNTIITLVGLIFSILVLYIAGYEEIEYLGFFLFLLAVRSFVINTLNLSVEVFFWKFELMKLSKYMVILSLIFIITAYFLFNILESGASLILVSLVFIFVLMILNNFVIKSLQVAK